MWTKTHEGELVNLDTCSAIKKEFKPNCRIVAHMADGSRYTLIVCTKPEVLEAYYKELMDVVVPKESRWWGNLEYVSKK